MVGMGIIHFMDLSRLARGGRLRKGSEGFARWFLRGEDADDHPISCADDFQLRSAPRADCFMIRAGAVLAQLRAADDTGG